jgi:hypothetical protein
MFYYSIIITLVIKYVWLSVDHPRSLFGNNITCETSAKRLPLTAYITTVMSSQTFIPRSKAQDALMPVK